MRLIILQYFGIGDSIWEQTLVHKLAKGHPVLWPVEPHFVEGLNRAYPQIFFVDRTKFNIDYNCREDYVKDGIRYVPLRFADSIMQVPYKFCMESKYRLYDMDWRDWKQQAMWCRDRKREDALFAELGLKEGMEYTLVNRFFGSNSQLIAPISERGIEMCSMPGYSLFDWAKVIEQASEIRTVSTSIIYLLELLELKAKEIHLYPRKPIEQNFENVEYILQKHKYIFHE